MTYISRFVYRVPLLRGVVSVFWAVIRRWFRTEVCGRSAHSTVHICSLRLSTSNKICIYLAKGTSWQLLSCPPVAADFWGLGPARRQRQQEHRHGDQGTEGQHPVGSMPAEVKREDIWFKKYTLVATCIFIFSYVNMAPLSFLFLSHKWRITRYLCLLIGSCFAQMHMLS